MESPVPEPGTSEETVPLAKICKAGELTQCQIWSRLHNRVADPDLWIRICIVKVGSGSVWRDTNPDPDPDQKQAMANNLKFILFLRLFFFFYF